jgi:DNA polymerase elongation subunit (family B)
MKLIEMAIALAYSAKVNFADVFSQVRMWDSICYHHLRKKNIVLPPKKSADKNAQFVGAYVKEPQVGIHDWVVSFDLNSLYPHLMMQYNLSPEKMVSVDDATLNSLWRNKSAYDNIIAKEFDTSLLKQNDVTVAPNLMFFKRDSQGFFPEILEDLYERRKTSKKKMIEAQQMAEKSDGVAKRKYLNLVAKHNNDQLARKVQLNSAYGALGNQYFRFYDIRIAEAVTRAGQLSIRWIETRMNEYLNRLLKTDDVDYVIASDTDSIYVTLAGLVNQVLPEDAPKEKVVDFLDQVCSEKLEPYMSKCYNELADYMNAYEQKMFMAREAIASKGMWTAKKRYVLNVYDNEGVRYTDPKLKVMGLEAVKSSTPQICREKIKDALNVIMTGTEEEMIQFIEEFREEFKSLPAEDIAFPRGVNGIRKYTNGNTYIKHTPIHVKGSIIYNRLLRENNLGFSYERISDGDKIKFLHLREPNPVKDSVISIVNSLPKEFGLEKYIDYEKQFVKAFLDPIKVMLDCIGWKVKKTSSLERFFG